MGGRVAVRVAVKGTLRQERDRLPSDKLVVITCISLAVGLVSVVVAALLLHSRPSPEDAAAPAPAREHIGIVEQSLTPQSDRGEDLERRQRRELETWRWRDASHETAEIPIDRAMRVVEERAR